MAGVGGEERFEYLYQRFFPDVQRMLLRYTGDRELAEDIAQEVFIRVYRFWHVFDQSRRPWPWLATIAIRLCHNAQRRKRPSIQPRKIRPAEFQVESPEVVYLAQEQDIIAALPPRHRDVLLLKYRDRFRQKEIAEELGVSVFSADLRLVRARERFRRAALALRRVD